MTDSLEFGGRVGGGWEAIASGAPSRGTAALLHLELFFSSAQHRHWLGPAPRLLPHAVAGGPGYWQLLTGRLPSH